MMTDLSGKTALVTGASRGIGKATAIALRRLGADVIGTVNRARDEAAAIEAEHGIRFLAADFAERDAVDRLVVKLPPSLDILVNNAAIASFIPWGQNDAESIDREFAINVRAPLLLTQALGERIADDGRIIFVSSVVAKRGYGDGSLATYSATKGAIDTLIKHLTALFGARGITVNAVAPGAIETDMSPWLQEAGGPQLAMGGQALKRIGQADDIADAIAMIAGPAGRWITGQTIGVSGGTLV